MTKNVTEMHLWMKALESLRLDKYLLWDDRVFLVHWLYDIADFMYE